MAIDIGSLTTSLGAMENVTYANAQAILAFLGQAIQACMTYSSANGVLNFMTGTGADNTAVSNLQTQFVSFNNDINSPGAHNPTDSYENWNALSAFWINIAVELNALSEANGTSLDNYGQIPSYIGQSIQALPQTIADAAGAAANAVTPALSWAALAIAGVVVLVLFIRK